VQRFVEDLNKVYREEPALWESDYDAGGFFWIDCADHHNSVLSFARQNADRSSQVVVILNLTPVTRRDYRIGLPSAGAWRELLNSDAAIYGGANIGNFGGVGAENYAVHNQAQSAAFTLPPLSALIFKPVPSN